MIRFFKIILVLLAVCPIVADCATQQQTPGPVDTVNAFLTGLDNADLDSVVATFADDATVFLPIPAIPELLTGRKEIQEGFAPFLANIRSSGQGPPYMTLKPQGIQVQDMGTTAIVTFHLGKLPADESKEQTSYSRRTFVLQLIKGKWLIVHMHASNMMLPPKHKE